MRVSVRDHRGPARGLIAAALLLGACSRPGSVAEALTKAPGVPSGAAVLVPLSAARPVGQRVERVDAGHVRAVEPRCFETTPGTKTPLAPVEVRFAEGMAALELGADRANAAGGRLEGLSHETFRLRPRRDAACPVPLGTSTHEVITGLVVAQKASWEASAAPLVPAAVVQPVEVTLTRTSTNFGAGPGPATVIPLPAGFEGNARIDGFQAATPDGQPRLAVTLKTDLADHVAPPAGVVPCQVGLPNDLAPGPGCAVWHWEKQSGVNVWFEKNQQDQIVLHLDGYRVRLP